MERLSKLQKSYPQIADVRGLGAMVAVEFNQLDSQGHCTMIPDADLTKKIQAFALSKGLILLTCGVNGNVIRFLFPLTIEASLFVEALDIIEASIKGSLAK